MPEVDPASGLPMVEVEKKSNIERFNRLSDQKARSDQLSEDVGSEKGQLVLTRSRNTFLHV